jgi:hypothetical protein
VTKNGKKTFYLCKKKSLVCKVAAAAYRYTNEKSLEHAGFSFLLMEILIHSSALS